jgi:hypothetical protein
LYHIVMFVIEIPMNLLLFRFNKLNTTIAVLNIERTEVSKKSIQFQK